MKPALPNPSPDPWALEAAALPLAFAQVREDPRLDVSLVRSLRRGAVLVMIASGGDTAACLAREAIARLHLVDINPAQLALTRCKLDLAATASPAAAAAWLGHEATPAEARAERIRQRLDTLALPPDALGPMETVAGFGPDHAGRYERCFAELRRGLSPHHATLRAVLLSENPENARAATAPGTALGDALDAAFARVMSLPNLVCLFGEGATRNPRQPFAAHFAERARLALARFPARQNPFLWQLLAGGFPPGCRYDWFAPDICSGAPLTPEIVCHSGPMTAVLDGMARESADMVHLSNILDWLSAAEAETVLASARRVLRRGGRILLRQLNSTLDIAALGEGIAWDSAEGARWESEDRSFFYPGIFTGARL